MILCLGYEVGMSNDVRCCGSKCEAGCDTDHGTVEDYKGNKSITNKHAGQINALINKGFTNVVDDMYFASCKGSERRSCPSCSKYSKSYLTSKEDKYKGKGAYAYFGINSERYGLQTILSLFIRKECIMRDHLLEIIISFIQVLVVGLNVMLFMHRLFLLLRYEMI